MNGNILRIEEMGDEFTYDLEIDHPDHQYYLSNGMLTSNSHSYSYAIDSFMCAHLMTHHEPEWLCSYLESQMSNADARGAAIATVKSFGYGVGKVDINLSTDRWVIGPDGKTFVPPLLSVKGVGASALDEIIKNRPYVTIEDLCWDQCGKWRHSKFNRRALENLIKVGAFASMNVVGTPELGQRPRFTSWRQMHFILVENQNALRKKFGRETLLALTAEFADMDEWSNAERAAFHRELIGDINVDFIIETDVQARLLARGVKSIDDVTENSKQIAWFVLADMKHLATKAKGTPYTMVFAIGASGMTHRVNVWGAGPDADLVKGAPYIAELERNDYGISTRVSQLRCLSK